MRTSGVGYPSKTLPTCSTPTPKNGSSTQSGRMTAAAVSSRRTRSSQPRIHTNTRSGYKNNETGRVNAVWPGSSMHYQQVIDRPRYEDFDIKYFDKNIWYILPLAEHHEYTLTLTGRTWEWAGRWRIVRENKQPTAARISTSTTYVESPLPS